MNKKILLLLPALALILGGCNSKSSPTNSSGSGSEEQVAIESVEVTPAELEIESGQSATLAANVKPVLAPNKDVTWSTNNSAVATVDAAGRVTGVGKGEATITATSDADPTKSGSCAVKVTQPIFKAATTPVIDKEYRLGAYQENLRKRYFFTGNYVDQNGIRGETSYIYDDATIVKFEAGAGEGEYHIKYQKAAEWKYLVMGDDHHVGEQAAPDAERPWKWDSTYCTATRLIGTTTYFMGCYQDNSTVSGCSLAQVANDFIFQFLTLNIAVIMGDDYVNPGFATQLQLLLPDGEEGTPEWSLAPVGSAAADKVSIDPSTGLVSALADAVDGDKYTATVRWGEGEDKTLSKEIQVVALNYGTPESPLSVQEARDLIDFSFPTAQPMYVKGTIASNSAFDYTNSNKYWATLWLGSTLATEGIQLRNLRDSSTESEWSHVFGGANSLVGKEVTIKFIGEKYTNADYVRYQSTDNAENVLYAVPAYEHSSTINIVKASVNLEAEQSYKFAVEFEAGKLDAALWSVAPVSTADPSKVEIDQNTGVVTIKAGAASGAKYTVTAALFSNAEVTDTAEITVVVPSYSSVGSMSLNKNNSVTITNHLTDDPSDPRFIMSQGAVTVTVRKNTSSNDVNQWQSSYTSARFYVGHSVQFSSETAFKKVVLTCDSSYNVFKDSKTGIIDGVSGGASVSYDTTNKKIILILGEAANMLEIVPDKQIRVNNVELFKI